MSEEAPLEKQLGEILAQQLASPNPDTRESSQRMLENLREREKDGVTSAAEILRHVQAASPATEEGSP